MTWLECIAHFKSCFMAILDCNNNNNNKNTYRAPHNKFSKRFTYINLKVHYIQI